MNAAGSGRSDGFGSVTHLVIGPADHGVVRFGLRLAELMGQRPVHHESPHQVTTTMPADQLHAARAVHLQYTDALYGEHTAVAADVFTQLRRRIDAPVSVTLHDLPDPGDEPGRYGRRAESYRRVARAVDAVAVSSRHELLLLERILGPDAAEVVSAVIPLPVESPAIRVAGDRPAPLPEVAVFGFIYPGKGHDDVMAAMSALPPAIRFTALGRTADGHHDLRRALRAQAAASHRSIDVTGFVPDEALAGRLRQVAVPVVPARTISASGSINTWLAAGRRPLAAAGPYTAEFDAAYPGAIQLYRPGELPGRLADVLARPELSWLSHPLPEHLGAPAVAGGYARLIHGLLVEGASPR